MGASEWLAFVAPGLSVRGQAEAARDRPLSPRLPRGCPAGARRTARAEFDPTAALGGALTTPKVKHRAAVTEPKAFGGLLRAIDAFEGQPTTRAALQLMALLYPRPGELRMARWVEFDFRENIWTIPAERAKMRRPHRVPLSTQAVEILNELREIEEDSDLAFPSVRSVKRPISENMNAALRRMGYAQDEATSHGFRATASTLLNECGLWRSDAIERQLAHVESKDVRRAQLVQIVEQEPDSPLGKLRQGQDR